VFVSLGLGSVIASTVEAAPWVAVISRHKNIVFPSVAALLAFNYWFSIVRPRQMNCAPGDVCQIDSPAMRWNRRLFWLSVAIFVVAVVITYSMLIWVSFQPE